MIQGGSAHLVSAVLSLIALSSTVLAADAGNGRLLYQVHCLACHGEAGLGDGPMKNQFEIAIPDLTTIAIRNEGKFPTDKIHQIIDGRHESAGHGTREMPVWGFTFQASGRDTDQESDVQEMVSDLTEYLETLQAEAEAQPRTDGSGD